MSGLIDREMLEEAFGPENAREILDLFVVNVEETLQKLALALEAGDNAAGAAAAHELTGTAASVGSGELAACARQLEIMLNASLDPRAGEVLEHLRQLFGQVKQHIDESSSH